LAEELKEFKKERISKTEFLLLEQEAKLEVLKGKSGKEREIAEQKATLLRMKLFQKTQDVLTTSAIEFLQKFAEELEGRPDG
jgi:hypothetical protein